MAKLLNQNSRLSRKNYDNKDLSMRKVALFSILVSVFLVVIKITVACFTNSIGVYSEALNNGLDLVTVFITYLAIRMSTKPADKDHTYGHGKYENFSALLELAIIFILCFFIIFKSIQRIIYKNFELNITWYIFLILIISIILNIIRVTYIGKAAKKYDSTAFKANFINYTGDIFSSVIVIVGLIFANMGIYVADPIASIIISIIIIAFSLKIAVKTARNLLDYIPKEVTEKVIDTLSKITEINSIDRIKIHEVGNVIFINLDVCLTSNLYLSQVERIKAKIKDKVSENILNSEIIVEIKPLLSNENISDLVKEVVLNQPEVKGIHNIFISKVGNFIDLSIHVELDNYLKLDEVENLIEIAEGKVKEVNNNIRNVYIHIEDKKYEESWNDVTKESKKLIFKIKKEISCYVKPETCHDFTVLKKESFYNLAFHCKLGGDLNVAEAHKVVTNMENKIKEKFKNIEEISIRIEPKRKREPGTT